MAILSVGTIRPGVSSALGLLPGSSGGKSSVGTSSLFGDTGGKALTTPSFNFGEGGLSRTDSEFLNESRRNLADLSYELAGCDRSQESSPLFPVTTERDQRLAVA